MFGGHTHPYARLRRETSAQLLSGHIGLGTDPLAHQDLDGLVHAEGLSAGMGLRGNASRRPVLA